MMSQAQQQQQQALAEARTAFDASYRADLADPAYGPYMRYSQRTHRLWLAWSNLQWSQPMKQVQEREAL
jgi:hypothetical protein